MEEIVDIVTSLITNLGFPIAVCCYLFWSNNKERESAREERLAHAEEMSAMRNAVEANTELISEIKATLTAFITLVNGGGNDG